MQTCDLCAKSFIRTSILHDFTLPFDFVNVFSHPDKGFPSSFAKAKRLEAQLGQTTSRQEQYFGGRATLSVSSDAVLLEQNKNGMIQFINDLQSFEHFEVLKGPFLLPGVQ